MAGRGIQEMNQKVIVSLNSGEISRLIRAILDEDKEEALLFLKEVLKPQVDQATRNQ